MGSVARGIITLISDFGTRDHYVGEMKGVMLCMSRDLQLVDITHEVPPGDVRYGAYVLGRAYPRFPHGTVHLAVVDPGVGGKRRPIVVENEAGTFVGPDNGIFSPVLDSGGPVTAIEISEESFPSREISGTFHGRDIFAPVAARLATGEVKARDLGPVVDDPVLLERLEPEIGDREIAGQFVYRDRFGNMVTNVDAGTLQGFIGGGTMVIEVRGRTIEGLCKTYSDAGRGRPVALIGSSGYLEVGVSGGDAGRDLGLAVGDPVRIVRA